MIAVLQCVFLMMVISIAGDTVNGLLFKNRLKDSWPLRLSLAYGLGTGVFGLLIFYLSYLGAALTAANLSLVLSPFLIIFIYKSVRDFKKPSFAGFRMQQRLKENGITGFFLYGLIIAGLVLIIFKALFLPMHLPDDRAQWGLKAKILYHDKTIYAEDFFDPLRIKLHVTYPFLMPILESSCFSVMGEMNDRVVKIIFPLFFIALLLFLYSSQRRYVPPRHALVFTAMLAVLPVFIKDLHGSPSTGYADIPLAFYYAVSTVSIFNWMHDKRRSDLIVAALFITFAIFTKREGLILWAILIIVMSCYLVCVDTRKGMNKFKSFAVFLVLPLILLIPWLHFSSSIPLPPWEQDWRPSHFNPGYIFSHFYRIPAVLTSLKDNLLGTSYWNILWILFLITIVFYPGKSFAFPQAFLVLTVGLNILALVMSVILYPWDWWYNFPYDMHRLLIINVPLVVYCVSYHIGMTGTLKRR